MSETAKVPPSPQELSALPPPVLSQEITYVEDLLASRYNPNGTEALLADEYKVRGKEVKLAAWADVVAYRANLYLARGIQAAEASTGGIGLTDVEIVGGQGRDGGWNDNGWSY